MKRVIDKTDREIAAAILRTLARHPDRYHSFCLSTAYEYDINFLGAVADALNATKVDSKRFLRKLSSVCRRLENAGVLYGRVSSCHAEYIGEPRVLKSYQFADAAYACRLAPERHPHYKPMGGEDVELSILLDYAYPES